MILPPATLGLLGGGQLGRYFVSAAHAMGYRVAVIDPDANSPAGRIAHVHLVAEYDDQTALDQLAEVCSAITTEFENVPASTLAYLAQSVPVHPSADAVAICQNRILEKNFLVQHRFPHVPYAEIQSEADINHAEAVLFPGILKVASFGYDGKGQQVVQNREEAVIAYREFNGKSCTLEKKMSLDCEISIVLARDASGKTVCFNGSKNRHHAGILDVSIAPSGVSETILNDAKEVAEKIAQTMEYVGTLGVEFFIVNGQIYINEIAPRPHNSGHYTLDACVTNQFEQQVRALCGLPLGEAQAHSVAAMVNLMGDLWYPNNRALAREPDWHQLLSVPNLKLHLYGKTTAVRGRKMGHFTVVGQEQDEVWERAMAARHAIGIDDQ